MKFDFEWYSQGNKAFFLIRSGILYKLQLHRERRQPASLVNTSKFEAVKAFRGCRVNFLIAEGSILLKGKKFAIFF